MNKVHRLLAELSQPAAYPYGVDAVVVQQTHISMVFVAGPFVYKLKKPVQLGFLDFGTLQRRNISVMRRSGSTGGWPRTSISPSYRSLSATAVCTSRAKGKRSNGR